MAQELKLVGLHQSLALNDPFAVQLCDHFSFMVDTVDEDMRLVSNVYRWLSSSSDGDYVRLALAAAGRLQAIAMIVQSSEAYRQYTIVVEAFIRWLSDLDMYLRTLPR